MNIHAYKTNAALYANAIAGKRNPCTGKPKRICKNIKPDLHSSGSRNMQEGNNPRNTMDSIIAIFNGAVVADYDNAVEWGNCDRFAITVN